MPESHKSYIKHRNDRRETQAEYYKENKDTNRDEINKKKREAYRKKREGMKDKRKKGMGGIIPANRGKYKRLKKKDV